MLIALYKVQKYRNNSSVHKIDKQTPYQRDDEKRAGGGAVFGVNHLHVCHSGGHRAQTETSLPDGHNRRVEIFTHDTEGHKDTKEGHQHHLRAQDHQHRQSQVNELPELHRHHGQGQENQQMQGYVKKL